MDAHRQHAARHQRSLHKPALAGMTPLEAATKPRKRDEVVLMLKEIENHESHAPADERIDVSKLWGELGLREVGR